MSIKNPWLSLASYQTRDSYRFKGRSDETIKFYDIIHNGTMSVLYANSGTGKTSFINAAIVPKLQAEDKYLPIRVLFPDDKDIKSRAKWFFEFIKALKAVDPENDKQTLAEKYEWKIIDKNHEWELEEAEEEILSASLWWLLHNYELRIKETKERVLPLFIFDQFEEVFTKPIGEGDDNTNDLTSLFKMFSEISSKAYPSDVLSVLRNIESRTDEDIEVDTNNNFKVIFSLRKEYLSDFDYWANDRFKISELRQNRMFLLPMTRWQAIQVITEQPIDEDNPDEYCERLDNIKDDILNIIDEKHKNVVEPIMLSLICSNLFELSENNGGRPLASGDIEKNDINTIVGKFYEEAVSKVITDSCDRNKFEEAITDKQGHRERKKATSIMDWKFDKLYKKALADAHIIRIEKYDDEDYVELIHDKLAQVVFEAKEKRLEEEHIAALEKEQEETQRRLEKETIEKNAIEKSKGDMILTFSLVLHYFMAMAGAWSWYHLYKIDGKELLPWIAFISQMLICVPVSSFIIRKKANARIFVSFFVIGMLGIMAALSCRSTGMNPVYAVMKSYNYAAYAMGLYSILVSLVYLFKKGNLKKLFSRSSPVLSILSELRVRLFFVLTCISGILLIDTYYFIEKPGGYLITIPTIYCSIAVLFLFIHKSSKTAYWVWTIICGVLIIALGTLSIISKIDTSNIFSEVANQLNTTIGVTFLVLSVVILFYLGFKYYNKRERVAYIIANVAVLLTFYFMDLQYNPLYFIGKEVVVPLGVRFYSCVLTKEDLKGNNSTEKVYYIYDAWDKDGRKVFDCPFDSIGHQGGTTYLYIKTGSKFNNLSLKSDLFKETNNSIGIKISFITAIENIRKHCCDKEKKDTLGEYLSSGLIEITQSRLNRTRSGKKLEISSIPNVVKAKDSINKRINQMSNKYNSCKNDSLVYSLYELEAKLLFISGIIDAFERNAENKELDKYCVPYVCSLVFEYHEECPNIDVNLNGFKYTDYELMQTRTQFEPAKKYWMTIFQEVYFGYVEKVLNEELSMDNYSLEKTKNSLRGTLTKSLDEQWNVVSKMAKSSDYDSGKFRYLLSSLVLAHRILNVDSIDWKRDMYDDAEISFDGKGVQTLDMLWKTKIENEIKDLVPIELKELLIESYRLRCDSTYWKCKEINYKIDSLIIESDKLLKNK